MSDQPSLDPRERAPEGTAADESPEAYFDRLDAAFTSREAAAPDAPVEPRSRAAGDGPQDVPTLDAILGAEAGPPAALGAVAGAREPLITDALVDELTRRVLERLAPDALGDLVAQRVTEVAERIVRDEIVRMRSRQERVRAMCTSSV